jgi:four helix bundle protein
MKIEKFEDIEAWKKGRELAKGIYTVTAKGEFAKDFGLRDQIQRATVSIMANIAEGFDANSDDEFVRFLRYALRSATEVQSHMYVAADQGYISKDEFTQLYDQGTEVKSLIAGFIRYLKA